MFQKTSDTDKHDTVPQTRLGFEPGTPHLSDQCSRDCSTLCLALSATRPLIIISIDLGKILLSCHIPATTKA